MLPDGHRSLPPIKWNEVTWYSRLLAIILFLGVIPALSFYIGVQYQEVVSVSANVITRDYSTTIPMPSTLSQDVIGAWSDTPAAMRDECKRTGKNCVPGSAEITDSREMDFGPKITGDPTNAFNSYLYSRPDLMDCIFKINNADISIQCPNPELDEMIKVISMSTSSMVVDEDGSGPPYTTYFKIETSEITADQAQKLVQDLPMVKRLATQVKAGGNLLEVEVDPQMNTDEPSDPYWMVEVLTALAGHNSADYWIQVDAHTGVVTDVTDPGNPKVLPTQ